MESPFHCGTAEEPSFLYMINLTLEVTLDDPSDGLGVAPTSVAILLMHLLLIRAKISFVEPQ